MAIVRYLTRSTGALDGETARSELTEKRMGRPGWT